MDMPAKILNMVKPCILFAIFILLFIIFYNHGIYSKENLLSNGKQVVLELVPLDPRSIMQGDYVELRFDVGMAIEEDIYGKDEAQGNYVQTRTGLVVIKEMDGVHTYIRLGDGAKLEDGEMLLRYNWRDGRVVFGGGSFFFQEGFGRAFEMARFAELRVGEDGTVMISALLDENKKPITVKNLIKTREEQEKILEQEKMLEQENQQSES